VWRIVDQSETDPMMTPTRGLAVCGFIAALYSS
jgi:hypothetical protein